MSWVTEGRKTAPAADTLLADTGPQLANTTVNVVVVLTATALGSCRVQHRDAANTATISEHFVRCPSNDTREFNLGAIVLAEDERVRVISEATNLGDIQASIVTY